MRAEVEQITRSGTIPCSLIHSPMALRSLAAARGKRPIMILDPGGPVGLCMAEQDETTHGVWLL